MAAETHVELTEQPIDIGAEYAAAVRPHAGAVSLFVGTTRDTFEGRPVTRLEYEGYPPMALQVMREIAGEVQQAQGGALVVVRIIHRLGLVPVGEASVCITVSSAHRAHAMQATATLIDTLKARVPIWKKEMYGDTGQGEWKENKEAVQLQGQGHVPGSGSA